MEDNKEDLAISKYKDFQQNNLPNVNTLKELICPDFEIAAYKPLGIIDALKIYISEIEKYSKVLSKAAQLREKHYNSFIKGKKDEDEGHKYWREGMNQIALDAKQKVKYWKEIHKNEFDKLIKSKELMEEKLSKAPKIKEDIQDSFNPDLVKKPKLFPKMPRMSKAEIQRRAVEAKKCKARNVALKNKMEHEILDKEVSEINFPGENVILSKEVEKEVQKEVEKHIKEISFEIMNLRLVEILTNLKNNKGTPIDPNIEKINLTEGESKIIIKNLILIGEQCQAIRNENPLMTRTMINNLTFKIIDPIFQHNKNIVRNAILGIIDYMIEIGSYKQEMNGMSEAVDYDDFLFIVLGTIASMVSENQVIAQIKIARRVYPNLNLEKLEYDIVVLKMRGNYLAGIRRLTLLTSFPINTIKLAIRNRSPILDEPKNDIDMFKYLDHKYMDIDNSKVLTSKKKGEVILDVRVKSYGYIVPDNVVQTWRTAREKLFKLSGY